MCCSLYNNGKYHKLESFPRISVKAVPIDHGHYESSGQYDSSAFFIRDNDSGKEFLFFGDVETGPRIVNVWRSAAPKIPNQLDTIFIECSWPSSREDDRLYGHLKPERLRDEVVALAKQVYATRLPTGSTQASSSRTRPHRKKQKLNPAPASPTPVFEPGALEGILNGVRVFVIHCKEQLDGGPGQPMKDLIVGQVKALVDAEKLGVEILSADQGMHISTWKQTLIEPRPSSPHSIDSDMICW